MRNFTKIVKFEVTILQFVLVTLELVQNLYYGDWQFYKKRDDFTICTGFIGDSTKFVKNINTVIQIL